MFATWILFIFIMLIIPYLTFEAGYLRKTKCRQMGAERGYRTALSTSSPEAWVYAQKACAQRYMITGAAMAVCSLLLAYATPLESPMTLLIFTLVVMLFQCVVVLFLIASVESGLRRQTAKRPPDASA